MISSKIHIIALAALGGGISGGDRIFIEFARRWSRGIQVNVYVWEEGLEMCKREKLEGKFLKINLSRVKSLSKLGFIFTYFYRIFLGIRLGLILKLNDGDYVYSASEFWMDSLPAFILKLRYRNVIWVAAWYQTAPNPIKGFSEGKRKNIYRFSAFYYWFMQQPVKPLITRIADFILVNNEDEKAQFKSTKAKLITVIGAVDTEGISQYQKRHPVTVSKKYLAVFQGRFHPQKGVVELIDIWKRVTQKIPNAKLAMIGNGPLMNDVKNKIRNSGLENNVDLFGYLHNGDKKYDIFNGSMIVVHPAFYDSGGMAAAEAMAFGLPCIGFDLKSYVSYYPKGMLKVSTGNLVSFSNLIVELSSKKAYREKIGEEARKMVLKGYSWEKRTEQVLNQLGIIK